MNEKSYQSKQKIGTRIFINKTTAQIFMLSITLIVIVIFMSFATDRFYQWKNLFNILTQISILGIAAVGASIVIISGGIDLTLGTIISLSGCTAAALMNNGSSIAVAVIAGMIVALLCGLLNGVLIVLSKAEPFIITLGMMSVYKGITLMVTGGANLKIAEGFTFGRTKIFNTVPVPGIILILMFLLLYFMLKYTKFGRRIYAIGSNPEAAYLSGIKINRYKIYIYVLNSFILGIGAMVLLSRLGSGNSIMGDSIMLEAIAGAVIGGVVMSGGRGSVWGVFLGVLLIGIISNSLNLLRVPSFIQYVAIGAIIVGAVFISNIGGVKKR